MAHYSSESSKWNTPSSWSRTSETTGCYASGFKGLALDDDIAGRETATGDVSIGRLTSTKELVNPENVSTIRDTVTGDTFEIARFQVELCGAAVNYQNSEQPHVPDRSYETVASPDGDDLIQGELVDLQNPINADEAVLTGGSVIGNAGIATVGKPPNQGPKKARNILEQS